MKKIVIFALMLLLVPCIALADLTVYFLDVGQGDCAIIECDGEAMIIDGGLPGQSRNIYSFINSRLEFDRMVYMVLTHPDNDHVGGLPAVFEAAKEGKKQVQYIYSPIKEYDSNRFSDLKNKAEENRLRFRIPHDGDEVSLGNAKVIFYNCGRERKSIPGSISNWFKSIFNRDDPEENKENNDISLVVKIIYGDTSFLFTGDIEFDAEERLMSSVTNLHADVLKVAHHGSNSSSSDDFLSKVNPKYAVISCGKDNRYGHPHQETLDKFLQKNIDIYRTDLQGTITCHSDGHNITFDVEK